MAIAKKLLSLALAIIGLALLVVGLWFAAHLGSGGKATFRLTPSGTNPLVIEPSLTNRLDQPLTITVRAAAGDSVWTGVGAPSDVEAAIGTTPATRLTQVAVRHWTIVSRSAGTGQPATVKDAEIWRTTSTTPGQVSITVDQRTAPETIVVAGESSALRSVTVTWQHRTWFFQALVVALFGLLLASASTGALFASLKKSRKETS